MSLLSNTPKNGAQRLRELLAAADLVVAPGAYDCLSARLIEAAGFPAVYMTGFGTAASYLGKPDVGLLGMSEMVDQARRIVDAVDAPVIADADTGYGNPINVIRTVQAYERAGVAAMHIEDQRAPKKCGHMDGKQLISALDMVDKIRAAVAARRSPDFTIIARTDARAVEGLDRALARAHQYRDAGADLLFVEAPETVGEIEAIAASLRGVPLLFNWAEGGKTPPVSLPRLRQLGFRLVIFPISMLLVAARAMKEVLDVITQEGTPAPVLGRMTPFQEFIDFLGLPEVRNLEHRFGHRSDPTTTSRS
jgi:carboxyvinyl-carboxyphosphonate phosphorylmutase